ncbi:hypothetical protein ARMSODRAFT_1026469 [Armillaria solidipes]|uniref:Uncharacterized protein n=1 Tax=Armillaria solidipes TaxID=1076256 RepID=A0A2H3ANL6_9AGAR|nr:hypothetical protein ARMSODRAFT_1026469 [Armillaria solidipes]
MFLFPSFEKHVGQLEDLESDEPLKAIFEILAAIINAGSHSGHSDDTTKISDNIMRLSTKELTDETLLLTLKKYQCGFNHLHMAHLLCLQRNAEYDALDLYSTIKGKMNLKAMLEEMVVYAAVQARFTLSSCTIWSDQSDGFDLKHFNCKLCKIFIDSSNEDGDTWTKDTLEFYITYASSLFHCLLFKFISSEILKPKAKKNNEEINEDNNKSIIDQNHQACIKE